jgi:heptaprenyl diphosphate synthase
VTSDRQWLVCTHTEAALNRLEPGLMRAVESEYPELRAISSYLIAQGGKRLRPALVLLGGRFGDRSNQDALDRAAIALEVLHAASLYHDDVLDCAAWRRHSPSANARWGNILASLGGTYLFARASALLASLGPWANTIASEAVLKVSTGQVLEVEHAYDLDVGEPEFLDILAKKTATLFELPLRLGAFVAGASEEHVETLAACGRDLGLAFQLTDDALDLIGNPALLGKPVGRDLRAGVYTLPEIRACRTDSGREVRDLIEKLAPSEDDIAAAASLIRDSGAVEESLTLAREKTRLAQASLSGLPEGAARASLYALAEYAVARSS